MPNPEHSSEVRTHSRRDVLRYGGKIAIAAAGAVALNAVTPKIVDAATTINKLVTPKKNTYPFSDFNEIPWSSAEWWPVSAEYNPGRLRLTDDWMQTRNGWVRGPLALHDDIARLVFDYRTQALNHENDYTNFVSSRHPDMLSWAGKCHALALAGIHEPEPSARFYVETEAGHADKFTLEGLLVAFNQGAPCVPILNDASGRPNAEIIAGVLNDGGKVIANVPLGVGEWYRAVYLSGGRYLMTAFANRPQDFYANLAVKAWSVVPFGRDLASEVLEDMKERANPEVNRQVINYIQSLG